MESNRNVHIRNTTEYTFRELADVLAKYFKLCDIQDEFTIRRDEGWICINSRFAQGKVFVTIYYDDGGI